MLAPMLLKKVSAEEAYADGMTLLKSVGMAERSLQMPSQLSGGQRQRVAIARTMAMHPNVILFDEPTSALDPKNIGEVLSVIRRFRDDTTMIIVTHELQFAKNVANRIWYMDKGGIYEDGTPEQIFENPIHNRTRAFVNKMNVLPCKFDVNGFDEIETEEEIRQFCNKHYFSHEKEENILTLFRTVVQDRIMNHKQYLYFTDSYDFFFSRSELFFIGNILQFTNTLIYDNIILILMEVIFMKQDLIKKRLKVGTLIVMYILLVAQIVMFQLFDIAKDSESLINYLVTFVTMSMVCILTKYYFSGIDDSVRLDNHYYGILVAVFLYAFMFTVYFTIPKSQEYIAGKACVLILIYLLALLMIQMFANYFIEFYNLNEESKHKIRIILWIIFGVFTLAVLTNPFTKLIFYISPEGEIIYSDSYILVDIYPLPLFFIEGFFIFHSDQNKATKMAFASYFIIPMFFIGIDIIPTKNGDMSVESGVLFGALFSLYTIFFQVFVQNSIELSKKNVQLQEKQTQIMVSQIQPHFMYNTLTAIHTLCEEDPKLAQKTIEDFSAYLRHNMDSLNSNNCVPFEQELEHTKIYLEIELMRFSDILKVEYDIQCTDFLLPSLSLQPIVENAVKYGIRSREDGGTVTIKTYRKEDIIYVVVHDDGNGFDFTKIENDNRTHIGIENTKKRIESMCNGQLKIESSEADGTTVMIIIDDKE